MRRRTVRLIAAKELLDTLRDRRTLFVALVLPLLLYPALLLGLTQIIGVTQRNLREEKQRVLVVGGSVAVSDQLREMQLEPIDAELVDSERITQLRADSELLAAGEEEEAADAARSRLRAALAEERYAGVILCAPDFRQRTASFRQAEVTLLFDPTDEPSKFAQQKVREALDAFVGGRREALRVQYPDEADRLLYAEAPIRRTPLEVASSSQKGAYSFAPMLGMLIVVMALTGAFYPAVDLAAGEKERGTMETLLVAPVTRREIVLGKFMAIWVIAVVTALLNLFVMGLTFSKLAGMMGSGRIAFSVPASAMFAVTAILIPTTALFSAVALALSSFATSYKEGQHYLSPLFLVAMPLAMIALLPNIEIGYTFALVPISNVVLLVKSMLLGGEAIGPAIVATLATVVYAGVALAVAVSIFRKESVLFRTGSGRGYDAAALRAERAGLPTEAQGFLAFFVVLAAMFFFAGRVETTAGAVRAFLLAQLGSVLLPTFLLARRFRVNVRETFSLRGFSPTLVPVIVAAAAFTLVLVLGAYRFLPQREAQGFEKTVELLQGIPAWAFFCFLAVLPPICEELLCRGFLLAAFRTRRGAAGAIVLTAALFGALHLDVYRFPATFAAGLVLGFVCLRTRSVFASILFHMAYNGLIAVGIFLPALTAGLAEARPLELAASAAGLVACLVLVHRRRLTSPEADVHSDPSATRP